MEKQFCGYVDLCKMGSDRNGGCVFEMKKTGWPALLCPKINGSILNF